MGEPIKKIMPFVFRRKKKRLPTSGDVRPTCHTRASRYSKNDRRPEPEYQK